MKCPKCPNTKEFIFGITIEFGVTIDANISGEKAAELLDGRIKENFADASLVPKIAEFALIQCGNPECEHSGYIQKFGGMPEAWKGHILTD